MDASGLDSLPWRLLAGGSVSVLGAGLLGIPLLDMWDDVTNLSWGIMTTVVENTVFLLLAGIMVAGGIWLVRTDWETRHVVTAAKRTFVGTAVVAVLIGWAAYLQFSIMGALKPGILALNGVLVGSVTSFGLSVTTVQSDILQTEKQRHETTNRNLERLYEASASLETATSRSEAFDIVEEAVASVVDGSFRLVVDGEVPVEHGRLPEEADEPTRSIDIGGRGRIELYGRSYSRETTVTVDLFATYLRETLQRIEREFRLREERDALEFTSRTLQHDLMGDISLLQARLEMLENDTSLEGQTEDHLDIAVDRAEEMESFVQTMRTYMVSKIGDDHSLEAVALPSTIAENVDSVQQAHPEAEVDCGEIPSVAVFADDLLDRVFVNLLTNAIEHNDSETPRVAVDAELRGETVRVRVEDNGPGIPPQVMDSLFERGERGARSRGSGFGLYLVKDVVEGYGGSVSVEQGESGGTVFEIDLPVAEENSARASPG